MWKHIIHWQVHVEISNKSLETGVDKLEKQGWDWVPNKQEERNATASTFSVDNSLACQTKLINY